MGLLSVLDWAVVAGYFIVVLAVAVWASRTRARDSSTDYFLAGRNAGWFVIGGSMFATNIGSEHLVGLAGEGAATGVAVAQFEILAVLVLCVLGWLFVPFYLRSGVSTMPEFLERRYSPAARWYLAIVSVLAYVLTKISVTIFAGQIVFSTLMGIHPWLGALVVVAATGVYTIVGGLRAVMYTDVLQTIVLLGGAVAVFVVGVSEVGGWEAMASSAGTQMMSIWKPASDPNFPWTGILFGAPILGIWYWCTDQFVVQRVLSARNLGQARRGALFAAALKLVPLFVFVVPGVIAAVLAQRGQIHLDDSNAALPTLVAELLPTGLRGLVAAGLLAALMSSLSSVFNSCSTLITLDIYQKLRPRVSERHLVMVGQLSTVALVALGLLWIPVMKLLSGSLYTYLQSVQAYISPPIAAVFLLGLVWPRLNGTGAMAALISGFALGTLRLCLELVGDKLPLGFWHSLATMNFLHFAIFLFVASSAVLVLASFTKPAAPLQSIAGLTFATTDSTEPDDAVWRRQDLWITATLVACVAVIWWWFR